MRISKLIDIFKLIQCKEGDLDLSLSSDDIQTLNIEIDRDLFWEYENIYS